MTQTKDIYTTEISFSYRSDTDYVPSKVHFAFTSGSKRITTGTIDYEVQLELPKAAVGKDRFALGAFGFAEPDLKAPGN